MLAFPARVADASSRDAVPEKGALEGGQTRAVVGLARLRAGEGNEGTESEKGNEEDRGVAGEIRHDCVKCRKLGSQDL